MEPPSAAALWCHVVPLWERTLQPGRWWREAFVVSATGAWCPPSPIPSPIERLLLLLLVLEASVHRCRGFHGALSTRSRAPPPRWRRWRSSHVAAVAARGAVACVLCRRPVAACCIPAPATMAEGVYQGSCADGGERAAFFCVPAPATMAGTRGKLVRDRWLDAARVRALWLLSHAASAGGR